MHNLANAVCRGHPIGPEVLAAREKAGLTQRASADLVHVSTRAWARYEAGDRRMSLAAYELFLRKTGLY